MAGAHEIGGAPAPHPPIPHNATPPAAAKEPPVSGTGDTSRLGAASRQSNGAYPNGTAPQPDGDPAAGTPEQAAQAVVDAETRAEQIKAHKAHIKALKERIYAQKDPCPPKSMSLDQKAEPIRFVESHVKDLTKQHLLFQQEFDRLPKDANDDDAEQKKFRANYKQRAQQLNDELEAAVERRKDLGNAQGWLTRMTQSGAFAAVTGIGGLLTGLVFLPQAFAGMGGGKHTASQDAADPSTQSPDPSTQLPDPSMMQQSKMPSPPPQSYTSYAPQPIVYNPYPPISVGA